MSNTGGVANPAGAHLMICLALDRKRATAVIVPVISRYEYSDASCLINVGDHPFIKHESCAAYDFCRVIKLSEASAKVDKGGIKLQPPASLDMLKRLQVGFVVSDEVAPLIFEAGNGQALSAWLKHQGHMS